MRRCAVGGGLTPMAEAAAGSVLFRRPTIQVAIDRIWRFFCSVRAAVYEIVVLAVLVLIGTLRGSSVPNSLAEAIPLSAGLVERWYAWDVFHSLAFMVNLAVLAVAIAICTINRAPAIWRAIAQPTVATTYGLLRSADHAVTVATPGTATDVAAALGQALRARHYRVLTELHGAEVHLYADKNRYARLGTFPFHLALIMLLIGGIVGARYGFRDAEFILTEGAEAPVGHGTDLSVRLDSLSETYREDGSASEFRSDLIVLDGGKEVERESITVNNPLTHDNVVFYQSGLGQAVALQITGPGGVPLYDDAVPIGVYRSRTNPDAPAGVLDLPQAGVTLNVIAPDEQPANAPELDRLRLRSGEIFVEVRPTAPGAEVNPVGAAIGQGQSATLDGLSVRFVREKRFTVLQIGRNPGIPIFIAASLLLVGGLAVTFYFPHRRVRGIVTATGGVATAIMAPLARRDWSAQQDFDRLIARLEIAARFRVERRSPVDPLPPSPASQASTAD